MHLHMICFTHNNNNLSQHTPTSHTLESHIYTIGPVPEHTYTCIYTNTIKPIIFTLQIGYPHATMAMSSLDPWALWLQFHRCETFLVLTSHKTTNPHTGSPKTSTHTTMNLKPTLSQTHLAKSWGRVEKSLMRGRNRKIEREKEGASYFWNREKPRERERQVGLAQPDRI